MSLPRLPPTLLRKFEGEKKRPRGPAGIFQNARRAATCERPSCRSSSWGPGFPALGEAAWARSESRTGGDKDGICSGGDSPVALPQSRLGRAALRPQLAPHSCWTAPLATCSRDCRRGGPDENSLVDCSLGPSPKGTVKGSHVPHPLGSLRQIYYLFALDCKCCPQS